MHFVFGKQFSVKHMRHKCHRTPPSLSRLSNEHTPASHLFVRFQHIILRLIAETAISIEWHIEQFLAQNLPNITTDLLTGENAIAAFLSLWRSVLKQDAVNNLTCYSPRKGNKSCFRVSNHILNLAHISAA